MSGGATPDAALARVCRGEYMVMLSVLFTLLVLLYSVPLPYPNSEVPQTTHAGTNKATVSKKYLLFLES